MIQSKKNDSGSNRKNTPAPPPVEELFGYYPPGYTEPYDFEDEEIIAGEQYEPEDFDPREFMTDYNMKFRNAMPIMFRDETINRTLSCLISKFKPNPLLVGVPGCGKTCIAEDIARRLAHAYGHLPDGKGVPEPLKGFTVWELPVSSIISGSGLVGDVEKKARDILLYASNPANKVILFIDEIHLLAESDKVYEKLAQIFKPALARGEIKVIGATTIQESQRLMSDPAFNRRFTTITVDELTPQQTKTLLRENVQKKLCEHYCGKVRLSSKVIDELVPLADEFHTAGSHRPDNAITLLDMAMSEAYIKYSDSDTAAKHTTLSVSMVKKTASKLVGGCTQLNVNADGLRKALSVIKGQDTVLDSVVDAIVRRNLGLYPMTKPLTLLFAGNSGVGKTETAKIIARELLDTKPITLNMTEFTNEAAITRILGAPPGYLGSDSRAEMPFDKLEGNPYQVILLDEFEKCDRAVQRLFMSVFDEGTLTTARGRTIDFSKAIIIASTNAGHTARASSIGFANESSSPATVSELSESFDTELLNRFSLILNFAPISEQVFRDIIIDKYKRHIKSIKGFSKRAEAVALPDRLSEEELNRLVRSGFSPEFGARHTEDLVRKYIEDKVLKAIASCTI